jgi:hypothetical protein
MKDKDKKWEVQRELEQIAPELARFKKQTPKEDREDVPPRYFRELPDELWQRIQAEEQVKSNRLFGESWHQLVAYIRNTLPAPVSIGMATIVFLLIGLWFFRGTASTEWTAQNKYQPEELGKLPEEVLYDYVLDHISAYTTSDFAAFGADLPLDDILPIRSDAEALDQIIDDYLEQVEDINFNELL